MKKAPAKKTSARKTPETPPVKTHKVTKGDIVEVSDTDVLISVHLQRLSQATIDQTEINDGQRFFPYAVMARLLVGYDPIGYISSFEMKMTAGDVFPQIIVRFLEKMPPEEVEKISDEARQALMRNIDLIRQFPFVTVESPLLTQPPKA